MNKTYLKHYGIKGQKWGDRNGPPYPLTASQASASERKRNSFAKKAEKMNDDELRKKLANQVRKSRAKQYGWSNQWISSNTIGPNSKKAYDRYKEADRRIRNSESYKQRAAEYAKLERQLENHKIDIDDYDRLSAKIDSRYPELMSEFKTVSNAVVYGRNGKEYVKEFVSGYAKDINTASLMDLGYDERTAKDFANRILKSHTKSII